MINMQYKSEYTAEEDSVCMELCFLQFSGILDMHSFVSLPVIAHPDNCATAQSRHFKPFQSRGLGHFS